MSRAAAFLSSLGVGSWLLLAVISGCSSSNDVTNTHVSAEAGAGNGGGLSAVTDGTDAGADRDSTGNSGGSVAPSPILSSIAPTFAAVGALGPTLVVKGTSFTSQSVIRVNSTALSTTFFSDAELHAALPNDDLALATTLHISVFTPAPGGGSSADLPFEVRNPTPALTALSPSSALAGASDTALTLSGSSFAPMPSVYFDGTSLTVATATTDTITTTIPAALLATSGSHNVTVVNAAPGGGTSNAISYTVTNPSVAITSVSPSSALVGDAGKSIAIVGSGFVSATTIAFNGTTVSSTFTDSAHITATLPASSFTNPGNFPVTATNPAPGGGLSAPVTFQVQNPIPVLSSLTPNTVYFDASDTTITVNGSSFVSSSVVVLGTSKLTTTFVSSTQLTAVVPASALTSLTTLSITVTTPAPGGGTSAPQSLMVTCDATGVDVALGAVGNITTRSTYYIGPDVNHVASAACPETALSGYTEPQDVFVVQNTTSSSVVLSTWAVCSVSGSAQSDGFLAVYSGGTAPASDAARMACATGTVASEGALGAAGDYESPDSNGSEWCPGLTKANGAGLTLAACAKAVVTLAPYSVSSTSYTPPTQIRFEPEAP
jgi:hypothetical protein